MSIEIPTIPQQREQRENLKAISASPDVATTGKGVESEIKEFLSPVDALGDAKNDVAAEHELKPGDVDKALSNLNDYAQNFQRNINFSVDEYTDRTVIRVIDSESNEVIRQIPSEDILEIARAMDQFAEDSKGKIIHAQA